MSELVVVGLVALVAYFWWSAGKTRAAHEQQREAGRREADLDEASVLIVDLSDGSKSSAWRDNWTLDFEGMSLRHEVGHVDFPSLPTVTEYVFRRRGPGDWRMKQTKASAAAAAERLQSDKDDLDEEDFRDSLDWINKSQRWHDLPDTVAPEAERGYQRFIRGAHNG